MSIMNIIDWEGANGTLNEEASNKRLKERKLDVKTIESVESFIGDLTETAISETKKYGQDNPDLYENGGSISINMEISPSVSIEGVSSEEGAVVASVKHLYADTVEDDE